MRIIPFLGFVSSNKEPELAEFLGLDNKKEWSIFMFEWFNFVYTFFAVSSNRGAEE